MTFSGQSHARAPPSRLAGATIPSHDTRRASLSATRLTGRRVHMQTPNIKTCRALIYLAISRCNIDQWACILQRANGGHVGRDDRRVVMAEDDEADGGEDVDGDGQRLARGD